MEEVYEPLVARRLQTVLVVGVLLLGVAGGIGLLWRQERRGQDRAEAALQVSRDRMQSTLDSMLEGAQIIGFDYRYLYVNDSVAAQGKQPKAELLGRTMMERYPGIDQTEFFRGLRRCMEQRESLRLENEFTFPDGSQGWFDLSLQPVPEGVFILSQDVTERKRAEQAVRRHAEELEVRVAERTQELQAANRELEAFSYSVSHDLRAPLRAADGFARILQEDHADSLPADARRYLDLVRGSTQQMGRLIDDLLAFSRLGRQAISRRPVQPATVARQAIEQLQDGQEGRRVEIEVEEMPDVSADPQLLLQVYVNLLSNALKFSRGREPARIQIGSCEQDGERVYFVRDNGAGFDMGYVDKLFGVFQRLHRAEEFEGTGVGLAIVQRIVHRHGGRAWAEGAVDQGATFYFTLPEGSEG
jgi:PAS domain S-box-containing protein